MLQKIAKFHKVSLEQFTADWCAATGATPSEAHALYDKIELPRRATGGSAGYDFFAPVAFSLVPNETILIPTGIRAQMQPGWVLQLYPRSGLGFRYRLQMDNTVGIVDSDYFDARNEGHIFVKMTSLCRDGQSLTVAAGEAFFQGIFLPFGLTEDDDVDVPREGGFGSTTSDTSAQE